MIVDTAIASKLCTGLVRRIEGQCAIVALDECDVAARVAVAPYRPAAGDEVLVVTEDDRSFVIGVLRIAGTADLVVPGDLQVRAGGRLVLGGAAEARLSAPRVSVEASALHLVARTVTERFDSARRWVRDCFQLQAGRWRTEVDGTWETRAGRISQSADGGVRIDGESIDLG